MDFFMGMLQKRLQSLRLAYSLPVLDAEWVCGVSRSSINFWERGKRIPSADGLLQIASSYGVSIDWLLGLTDTAYTSDSIRCSESMHLVKNNLLYQALTEIFNDDKYASELFLHYGNTVDSFSFQARADIIVSCLYLRGYDNYFAADPKRKPVADPKRKPVAQQKARMYEMRDGLLRVLKTKEPFSSLQSH